jgi:predicted NUDIX family NTP pyrophosphohydrolase
MAKKSAGIIVYRWRSGAMEVFIVHLGGPYWKNKDYRAWSFPKGEFSENEPPLEAAIREFQEETGQPIEGEFLELTPHNASGKRILAWAVEGEVDENSIQSNLFELEWPPNSGTVRKFPEIDRGAWFDIEEAKKRVHKGLAPVFEELQRKIGSAQGARSNT